MRGAFAASPFGTAPDTNRNEWRRGYGRVRFGGMADRADGACAAELLFDGARRARGLGGGDDEADFGRASFGGGLPGATTRRRVDQTFRGLECAEGGSDPERFTYSA